MALTRRQAWRPVRFLALAFPVLLVLTFLAGTQFYYPFGLLAVLFAADCVPTTDFLWRSSSWWRPALVVAISLNAAVSAVVAMPLLSKTVLGDSPVPGLNQTAGDQVGWPTYVRQIANVYDALPADDARRTVIIASNYGEAGAVARYGPKLGLSKV